MGKQQTPGTSRSPLHPLFLRDDSWRFVDPLSPSPHNVAQSPSNSAAAHWGPSGAGRKRSSPLRQRCLLRRGPGLLLRQRCSPLREGLSPLRERGCPLREGFSPLRRRSAPAGGRLSFLRGWFAPLRRRSVPGPGGAGAGPGGVRGDAGKVAEDEWAGGEVTFCPWCLWQRGVLVRRR